MVFEQRSISFWYSIFALLRSDVYEYIGMYTCGLIEFSFSSPKFAELFCNHTVLVEWLYAMILCISYDYLPWAVNSETLRPA